MVLAMQLSAMCFGALVALCIVACCAYKICGPAEEEPVGGRYSTLKPPRRVPLEVVNQVYTLPTSSSLSKTSLSGQSEATPTTTPTETTKLIVNTVTGDTRMYRVSDNPNVTVYCRSAAILNGRPGARLDTPPPAKPVRQPAHKSPKLLSLGSLLDSRPRLMTITNTSASKCPPRAGYGAANRLAAHNQTGSTLDLARAASYASGPQVNTRSLSDLHMALV